MAAHPWDSLSTITEVQLRLLGLEPLLASRPWWTRAGMQRFLRDWSLHPAGSWGELQLLLGLLDPRVVIHWPTDSSQGNRHTTPLRIEWSRRRLIHAGHAAREFCRRAVDWWSAPRGDENHWDGGATPTVSIGWRGTPLAVVTSPPGSDSHPDRESSMNDYPPQLWIDLARLHGIRRRRALPVRVLLAAQVDTAVSLRPGQLVVTDRETSVFVSNTRAARFCWKFAPEPASTRPGHSEKPLNSWLVMPLCDGERWLDLALEPEALRSVNWSIDGVPVEPHGSRKWPHWLRLRLPSPSQEGIAVRLTAHPRSTDGSTGQSRGGAMPGLSPRLNPFECRRVSLDSTRGAGWVEDLSPLARKPDPLVHPVAGHQELKRVEQVSRPRAPLPIEPLESLLARLRKVLTKRWRRAADLRFWLATQLNLPQQQLDCQWTSWLEPHPSKSVIPLLKRGWTVTVHRTSETDESSSSEAELVVNVERLARAFASPECDVRVIGQICQSHGCEG